MLDRSTRVTTLVITAAAALTGVLLGVLVYAATV